MLTYTGSHMPECSCDACKAKRLESTARLVGILERNLSTCQSALQETRQQRDELLAALEACLPCAETVQYSEGQTTFDRYKPIVEQARAAIAKAKGEAK